MRNLHNKPAYCSKLGRLIFNIQYSILALLNVNNFFFLKTEHVFSRVNQLANYRLSTYRLSIGNKVKYIIFVF